MLNCLLTVIKEYEVTNKVTNKVTNNWLSKTERKSSEIPTKYRTSTQLLLPISHQLDVTFGIGIGYEF